MQKIYRYQEYQDHIKLDWDGEQITMTYEELDIFLSFYKNQDTIYNVEVNGGFTHYGYPINQKEIVINDQYLINKWKEERVHLTNSNL